MRRNPLYIFKDTTSIGIFNIPLKSTVNIVDVGNGYPMFLQLLSKGEIDDPNKLNEYSTIADLLVQPAYYIDLGASGNSELEKVIKDGIQGWRILGRDPDNFGNIGNGAMDFSESDTLVMTGETGTGALGETSFASGYKTASSGENSFAAGSLTKASGTNSFATNEETLASGANASALGYSTISNNPNMTAVGQYNVGVTLAPNIPSTIFEIGVGWNELSRNNGFEVYLDGKIIAPSLEIADIQDPKSLVTKEYVGTRVTTSQLELLSGGTGSGWRLLGRDPDNFGNIGHEAVDFSYSNTLSSVLGATGFNSFAEGMEVIAGGQSSHAEGATTKAIGNMSHAEGNLTEAIGNASHTEGNTTKAIGDISHAEGHETLTQGSAAHAEGWSTQANGNNSHAEGKDTIAIGDNSHVEGYKTIAKGNASHAEGQGTVALNAGSHACGWYNVGVSIDTMLEVGNGTDASHRSNALEVYMDGRVHAPSLDKIEITHPKSLVTKEFLDDNSGNSELERLVSTASAPPCSGVGGDLYGWRLLGRDSNMYQPIGIQAVDFSYSDTFTPAGLGASGCYSFAEGYNTLSMGMASHAAGRGTRSNYDNQFVVGQYNDNNSCSIFEVGIGLSNLQPKNGFEVCSDGAVRAPGMSSTNIGNSADKSILITKDYLETNFTWAPSKTDIEEILVNALKTQNYDVISSNNLFTILGISPDHVKNVYRNGSLLRKLTDYTVTVNGTGARITLTIANTDDWISIDYIEYTP